jgi:ATP-dependent Clp protease adaptor protein ClpS
MANQAYVDDPAQGPAATATIARPARRPQTDEPKLLPPFKVILHNDDQNTFEHVIATIVQLTTLGPEEAIRRTIEAHETGCALLLVTHKERAELYQQQFQSASLTVTIEPEE